MLTFSENTASLSLSSKDSFDNNEAVARFVSAILGDFGGRPTSITITRPVKSEGYSVVIAITGLSDETVIRRCLDELQTTLNDTPACSSQERENVHA